MKTPTTTQKPALQLFLEETFSILGLGLVQSSDASAIRGLLPLWQHGVTPQAAADEYLASDVAVIGATTFEAQLADARDGLRNHAHAAEQEIRKISESITGSIENHGPVDGALYVSSRAQRLYRLKGVLDVYREYAGLLDIIYASSGMAKLALDVSKEDAVARLVNLSEPEPNSESAGVFDALKKVIKILTNTL